MAGRTLIPSLFLAIAITAIVAGCGGGSSDSSAEGNGPSATSGSSSGGSSSALTKEQYIEKANAICVRERTSINKEFSTYLQKHKGDGSQEEVLASLMKTVLLPSIENDIEELKKLEPPAGDKEIVEEFLNAQQKGVIAMSKVKRLPEGPAGEKYLEPASRLAKAYGIDSCAQS